MTFTCIRCTADTDNDDDVCDACAEEARRAPTTIGERQAIAECLSALTDEDGAAIPDHVPVLVDAGVLRAILATPTTNAPVADAREEAVKLITAHLEWLEYGQQDDERDEYTLADAILALRQTLPIHGEMREALERIVATVNEPDDHQGRMMRMARIARNALQGDGL